MLSRFYPFSTYFSCSVFSIVPLCYIPFFFSGYASNSSRYSFPTRRFSDLLPKVSTKLDAVRAYQFEVKFFGLPAEFRLQQQELTSAAKRVSPIGGSVEDIVVDRLRSEEHKSELQSHCNLVCRLLLDKKKKKKSQGSSRQCET